MPGPRSSFYDELLDLLSNVMFPVFVFLIWAAATAVGTIVDQNQPVEMYYQEYPAAIANIVVRLHLTNVFHSIPYISLVALLIVSMSVCTFRRVIPKRFPKDRAVPIENFGLHGAREAASPDVAGAADATASYLRRRGFAIRRAEIDGASWLFADKQKWARYGVLVAHLGFAVIVFGVFIYWRLGYAGQLQIFEGKSASVAQAGATLRLNKFSAGFVRVQTPNGPFYQASRFESHMTFESSSGSEPATTVVNHPYVSPQGIYFYQASYGYAGNLRLLRRGRLAGVRGATDHLMPQDAIYLPGTSRVIEYGTLLGPSDPSQTPMGVAVPAADEYALWVFHDNIPTTDRPVLLPVGKTMDVGDGFSIQALAPVAWTGLTYRYDPGQGWVGLGAAILATGFVMSLFFVPVKLYARVRREGGVVRVAMAATTTKGNAIYEDDFAGLLDGLGRVLEPPRDSNLGKEAVSAYA